MNRVASMIYAVTMTSSLLVADATTVQFRLVDTATGKTTPAMVCITGATKNEVRLPPTGAVATQPSRVDMFYNGIRFDAGHNWIGPIRKTMGKSIKNQDRCYVYELQPSIPYWRQPVMYQTSGDFTIDLPAGHWRIAVEHGMEYVPVVEEFDTTGNSQPLTKTIELKRWINLAERGWYSGDVHVHHPILEPAHREYLLHYAIAEDLHVVNILEVGDHKGLYFKQMGFGKKYRANMGDYWLVAGQEEPRSTFGHIIGLNLTGLVRDVGTYDFYDIAFRKIHDQQGSLVGFAHFAWNGCSLPRGFPWYVTTGDVDFIEVLQFSLINTMDYYDYLNLGFRLTAAAGSDVPWGSTIGEVRTYVHTGPKLDIDDWFANFKKGHTFVSNGPFIAFTVDGQLPGSEIAKEAGSKVKVLAKVWGNNKVGLPAALTIVGNDGVIQEILNRQKQTEMTIEIDVPIQQSQWLVASTVCDNNAVAHTTPVYVMVNGQPTWSAKHGPGVIQKQLKAIGQIEKEYSKRDDDGSKGVRERLQKAKDYYAALERKMKF